MARRNELLASTRPRSVCEISVAPPRHMVFTVDGTVPKDFCCVRCENMLNEPVLTGCCGKNLCRDCVGVEKGGKCPLCDTQGLSFVGDQRIVREIASTIVFCKFREEGCLWLGNVVKTKRHLEVDCQYAEVVCSVCKGTVVRGELPDHLKANCNIVWFQCSFCNQLLPEESKESHLGEDCLEYLLTCPNGCGVEVKRKDIVEHEKTCPNLVLDCQFKEAGCDATHMRKDQPHHLAENHVNHSLIGFLSLQKQVKDLNTELSKAREEMNAMKEEIRMSTSIISKLRMDLTIMKSGHKEIADLLQSEFQYFVNQPHTSSVKNISIECMRIQLALLSDPTSIILSPENSLLFRLSMYSQYKRQSIPWYSPPFIVKNGYQMCISVYLNGDQEGLGTHISIHIHLMAGSMDGKLTWPLIFHDIVTVSLVNQITSSFSISTSSTALTVGSKGCGSGSGGSSPLLKMRTKSGDSPYAQQQTIRTVAHILNRVNKPAGSTGLSFGYIALFYAQNNITPSVLVNDSLVFMLEIKNQNTIKAK